jgi:predicted nucleotidyltransferase
MALQIDVPRDAVVAFCRRWNVTELAFFGSVLRDDFRPDSDIDVLVTFAPGATPGLFALVEMQDELAAIFGRDVDLLTRSAVESSHNWIRRKEILSTAETFDAA